MKDVQKKLYDLLKKFDKICKDNDVEYYLAGGSALGAVRHKGFLPWDDDVDLFITRNNYIKLKRLKKLLSDNDLLFVDGDEYDNYSNVLIRLVDPHSTMITESRMVDGTPKGTFIEFFILDPIPNDLKEREIWLKKHWVYAELRTPMYLSANYRVHRNIDPELYSKYLMLCEERGRREVLKNLEDELFVLPEESCEEFCSIWGLRNLIYKIEWFGTPKYIDFEDIKLPVPQKVNRVLRFDYGDFWMYVPKENEQREHSMIFDLNIPYEKVVNEYLKNIDYNHLMKIYKPRKKALFELFLSRLEALKEAEKYHAAMVNAGLELKGVSVPVLEDLLQEKKYKEIESIFEIWYKTQFSGVFRPIEAYLDIGDEYLYYALLAILLKGEYPSVKKVLEWKALTKPNEGELKAIEDFVNNITESYTEVEEMNFELADKSLDKAKEFSYHNEQYDFLYLDLVLKVERNNDKHLLRTLISEAEDLFDKHNKWEVRALCGDIENKLGNSESAKQIYLEVKDKTDNGMLILHINDMLKKLA